MEYAMGECGTYSQLHLLSGKEVRGIWLKLLNMFYNTIICV